MYIVTFIQSDSNNVDSNLCSTPQEVLSKVKEFFEDSLLDGFPEWEIYLKDELGSKREDTSIGVGCYATIHIQALNSYSRQQLLLANQETPLAPQEPFKPFVVAATLPDNTEVVLGRFDTEVEQKMFESLCSIDTSTECKCAVCHNVLKEADEVYIDFRSSLPLCDSHSRFNEEVDEYEATEGDLECRIRVVIVVLEDNDHFTTSITGTKQEIINYYEIGSLLNMGPVEDNMVAIKELIFLS